MTHELKESRRRFLAITIPSALAVCFTGCSPPEWQTISRHETPLDQDLTYYSLSVRKHVVQQLDFLIFRVSEYELTVLDNGAKRTSLRYGSLEDAMLKSGCIAGSNGGFFELLSFAPNGLQIVDHVATGIYDPRNWSEGVLAVQAGELVLEDCKQFHPNQETSALIQTGPWLVQDSKPRLGYGEELHRRSFIATDGKGSWLLGRTDQIALSELSVLLISPAMQKFLQVQTALNLDGGPSSGLWIQTSGEPIYFEELTIVRNFLGLRKKNQKIKIP